MANEKARKATQELAAQFEQGRDIAHKIWLAGIGAYGRAFDEAKDGVENLTENTSEVFEDLVKRGSAIEADMKSRIASNESLSTASERVSKAVETATHFQEKQMERFEARMERMRDLLGLNTGTDKASKLHAKMDKLEDEIAELRSNDSSPAGNKALKDRLARLTSEIDAIASANEPKPAKARAKTAKKTTAKKTVAKKAPARKTAAKKTTTRKTTARKATTRKS